VGFSFLAGLYCREHQFGVGVRASDAPALDRALKAARQGIELKPQGSRAHHALFIVLFARGETEAAFAVAENAIALNKYDMILLTEYGGRLIYVGELDGGMDTLRRAAEHGTIRPSWQHFYLFLGHYLKCELAAARHHADHLTSETYVFGHMARALIAAAEGDAAAAQLSLERLIALAPAWKVDARAELARFFPAPAAALADRLLHDLLAAGLPAPA
jgi:tetratricopeptide (TPR) repeat protein